MPVEGSILTTIKKMLGIEDDYEYFDLELTMHINAALMKLNQLGVGPSTGLGISDKTTTWSSLLLGRLDVSAVMTYIYLNVRLVFDPPQNSFLVNSIQAQINELTWRINVQQESPVFEEETV